MNIETNSTIGYLYEKALVENPGDIAAVELLHSTVAQLISSAVIINSDESKKKNGLRTVYFAAIGSSTNELDPDRYFEVKSGITALPSDLKLNPLIQSACEYAKKVTPDIQIHIHHLENTVEEIFEALPSHYYALSPEYSIDIDCLDVSPHKQKKKLVFSLSKHGIPVQKMEFTNAAKNKKSAGNEKRGFMGGFEDIHSIPLVIQDGRWEILEEQRLNKNEPWELINVSFIDVSLIKDRLTFLEGLMRNGRKIISFETSHPDQFNSDIYVSKSSKYKVKNIFKTEKKTAKLLRKSSQSQIEVYYRELLVSASWNAKKTLMFLSQSGLDLFFFGKKIESMEISTDTSLSSELGSFFDSLRTLGLDLNYLADSWLDENPQTISRTSLAPQPQT